MAASGPRMVGEIIIHWQQIKPQLLSCPRGKGRDRKLQAQSPGWLWWAGSLKSHFKRVHWGETLKGLKSTRPGPSACCYDIRRCCLWLTTGPIPDQKAEPLPTGWVPAASTPDLSHMKAPYYNFWSMGLFMQSCNRATQQINAHSYSSCHSVKAGREDREKLLSWVFVLRCLDPSALSRRSSSKDLTQHSKKTKK